MLWWINSSLMVAWWSQLEHPHRFSSLSFLVYCPLLLVMIIELPTQECWSLYMIILNPNFPSGRIWWLLTSLLMDRSGRQLKWAYAMCLLFDHHKVSWLLVQKLIFLFFILFFFEVHLLWQVCVHNYMELSLFRIITNILLSCYNGSFDIIVFLWKASAHEKLFLQDSPALFLPPREKHACSMTIRSCAGFSVC